MTSDDRALSDERTLRLRAEERLAQEVDRTKLWRRRAEERQARIESLEERLRREERRPRIVRWVTGLRRAVISSSDTASEPAPRMPDQSASPRPRLASVSVAALADHPAIAPVLDEATKLDPVADPGVLASADVVVIDEGGWSRLDGDGRDTLRAALSGAGRPPLVVWTEVGDIPELSDQAVATVNHRPGPANRFLPGSYHRRPPRLEGQDALFVTAEDLAMPSAALITEASRGRPVMLGSHESDAAVAAHQALRWAFRHHRPSRRLGQLLDLVGVAHPDPTPSVAAILVSNRPELIQDAMNRLARQTWRPTEIIVGLHGFDDPGLRPPAEDIPIRILGFDERLTLGECLNRAIESTPSDLVAKIDDDDHYGPAYLEDAVRDLDSSGNPIVGKATVYAYLSSDDTTVLRRPGTEHRRLDGTMGGNTFVMERSVWEAVPFPHRPRFVDTIFLTAARRLGFTAYSGSRFEFCAVRHGAAHTYAASDTMLAAGSDPAWSGFHPERAFVPDLEATVSA
ncbi:MAG TPA: glycosyltransferase family A protein [Acidimicrobiia bacterium]|nr:glycosyltransferase family A protein [Acidimicrobiia bacterium]